MTEPSDTQTRHDQHGRYLEATTVVRVGQAIFGACHTLDAYYWPVENKDSEQ